MSISTPKVKPVPGGPRMTRYIALLSLTLVIGIAVLSSSAIAEPQAATAAKRCGHVGHFEMGFGGAVNIVARNMGCSFARDVARSFMGDIPATGPKGKISQSTNARNRPFKCATKRTGSEVWNSACSNGHDDPHGSQLKHAKVTFQWGA
ncbi:MAG: hypothetical protein WB462_03810 [Solirubrobacterales bacterium]